MANNRPFTIFMDTQHIQNAAHRVTIKLEKLYSCFSGSPNCPQKTEQTTRCYSCGQHFHGDCRVRQLRDTTDSGKQSFCTPDCFDFTLASLTRFPVNRTLLTLPPPQSTPKRLSTRLVDSEDDKDTSEEAELPKQVDEVPMDISAVAKEVQVASPLQVPNSVLSDTLHSPKNADAGSEQSILNEISMELPNTPKDVREAGDGKDSEMEFNEPLEALKPLKQQSTKQQLSMKVVDKVIKNIKPKAAAQKSKTSGNRPARRSKRKIVGKHSKPKKRKTFDKHEALDLLTYSKDAPPPNDDDIIRFAINDPNETDPNIELSIDVTEHAGGVGITFHDEDGPVFTPHISYKE